MEQLIQEIKSSPTDMFAIQLDETMDVSSCAQLLLLANGITWENCCGVCSDGAPAMLGLKSGLQKHADENFLQLANTEEYIDGQSTGSLGEVLIRCNNVLYIRGVDDDDEEGGQMKE
ncbi:Small nuclear ribonucleoprotein F-like, partial [Homarus americanus]